MFYLAKAFVKSILDSKIDLQVSFIYKNAHEGKCHLFHNRVDNKFNTREIDVISRCLKTHFLNNGVFNISFDYEEGMFETDSVYVNDHDRIEEAVRELKNDPELDFKIDYKCVENSDWNSYEYYAWETHTYYILHNRKDNEFTQDESEKIIKWMLNTFDDYKMYNYVFDYDEKVDRGITQ